MELSSQATRVKEVSIVGPQDRVDGSSRRGAGRRSGDALAAWALLTPNLIAYSLFIVIPAVTGVVIGFYSWDLFSTPEWVGLANYTMLLHDPLVATALLHSVTFVVLGVVSTAVAGVLWSTLFSPSYGMVNRILGLLHIPGPAWLASTTWSLPALTVV